MITNAQLRTQLKSMDKKQRVSTMNKAKLIETIISLGGTIEGLKTKPAQGPRPLSLPAPAPAPAPKPAKPKTVNVSTMKKELVVLKKKRKECDKNTVKISKLKKKIKSSKLVRISLMNSGYDMDTKTNDIYTLASKYVGRLNNETKQVSYDEKIGGKLEPIELMNKPFFYNEENNSVYTKDGSNILFIGNYNALKKRELKL